ncbi:hypothetical protein [Putridiphycobacter roseus]|nr:hypothetical protein [Putridiphycobacter roseus]
MKNVFKSILFVYLLFATSSIYACSCRDRQMKIDSAMFSKSSNEIFLGKVLKIEKEIIKKGYKRKHLRTMRVYTLEVKTNYSLSSEKSVVKIYTSTGNCGINYELGETYLISASNTISKKIGRMSSYCRRNVLERDAYEEISLLNKLVKNNS